MFKRIILTTLLAICLIPTGLVAQDIPAKVTSQLEAKGIPIFPGAIYCTGEASTGVRFASDKDPEKIREWYVAKYPKWSIMDKYGSWTLYDGPPGVGMAKVLAAKGMIEIKANEQLPSWHSLSSDMTTEILIAFPD